MGTCGRCGAVSARGATFCASCGASLAHPPTHAPPVAPAPHAPYAPAPERPVGVTLVAAAMLVGAGFLALGALTALVFVFLGAGFLGAFESMFGGGFFGALGGAIALFAIFVFLVFAAMVAFAIVLGIAVLRGRPWAWVGTLVILGLMALSGLFALAEMDLEGILGLAVAGLVGWYFLTPEVKRYFQRT